MLDKMDFWSILLKQFLCYYVPHPNDSFRAMESSSSNLGVLNNTVSHGKGSGNFPASNLKWETVTLFDDFKNH